MIFNKEKVKTRMVEFTSDFYWNYGKKPRFKDYEDYFKNLSVGTVNNYLKELCNEKKIQKFYDGNTLYYSLPKKHVTTKYFLISSVAFLLVLVTIAPFLFIVDELISFYAGCMFTLGFWRFFQKKKD